jgi:hypothetical protein
MKLTRYRILLAGVVGVAAATIPLSVPFVESAIGGASTPTPVVPDVLTYVQGAGTNGTYFQYTTGSDGIGTPTTQVITPSGKCGTPTVSGTPILGLSGLLYPPSGYSGSPKTVPVGTLKQHTGVCALPFPWQVENVPFVGTEGLDFTTVGANSAIGTNRIFSDAQIQISSQQWWPGAPIPVQLVEYLGGNEVGSVTCKIPAPLGSTITADTNTNSVCSGTVPVSGFDTVEVEVPQYFTSVSIVGTSTFSLAPQVCGGGSISSSGPVSATLNVTGTGCQSYTSFSSSNTNTPGHGQTITFNGYSVGSVPFKVTVAWPAQADCQPGQDPANADPGPPYPNGVYYQAALPTCVPTQFSFNGTTYYDQTYCSTATTADPLCTQNKQYNYVSVNGADETQITETWLGLIDWNFR